MKFSVNVPCQCGYVITLEATGTQDMPDTQCPKCGTAFWSAGELANLVGTRIFNRAWMELNNGDITLAIILSALAVECEMARLFIKWNELDLPRTPTLADRDKLEEQWHDFRNISLRIEEVSKLLTGENFDAFLQRNPGLLTPVQTKYSAFAPLGTSPKKSFVELLFKKRNRIVHFGEIDFGPPDGEICFTLAAALFLVMKVMDDKRSKTQQAEHLQALYRPAKETKPAETTTPK
jgi:hypothetical protein